MAKSKFDRVPNHYAGHVIQTIKDFRQRQGKRELNPTRLSIGQLEVLVPRYFGFCFGVERAIHMAFSARENNPDQRIYLTSEIIHNPLVNSDLQERGIEFVYDPSGQRQIPKEQIDSDDIVLIPAFGTTLEVEASLQERGIDTDSEEFRENYDTTCPFVSKVWDRGEQLAREGYTIVIHGKFGHEETQATHSHTKQYGKTLVVLDCDEARKVGDFIVGAMSADDFGKEFAGKWSEDFEPARDLQRVAVVNQTTMLAEETQEVAAILRQAMQRCYGDNELDFHFADTNDTLCYATNQNQNATRQLLEAEADIAVIVGGYNSSNTSHLVEICSEVMPSYLVKSSEELVSMEEICHFDINKKERVTSLNWLPPSLPVRIVVTSGASCPDVLMNQVIERIASFYQYGVDEIERGLAQLSLFDKEVAV
jgi:4-hydroxy-3-methylbut-2-enyl diphosphate reductase